MRTTIALPDDLLSILRQAAAARGVTLSEVVEEAVRFALASPAVGERTTFVMPTNGGGRVLPGVDLNDSAGLLDLIERR